MPILHVCRRKRISLYHDVTTSTFMHFWLNGPSHQRDAAVEFSRLPGLWSVPHELRLCPRFGTVGILAPNARPVRKMHKSLSSCGTDHTMPDLICNLLRVSVTRCGGEKVVLGSLGGGGGQPARGMAENLGWLEGTPPHMPSGRNKLTRRPILPRLCPWPRERDGGRWGVRERYPAAHALP